MTWQFLRNVKKKGLKCPVCNSKDLSAHKKEGEELYRIKCNKCDYEQRQNEDRWENDI